MAIRIIYDQTLPATQNGEATGWIKVLDVTQLVAGCTGFIYDSDTGPIGIRVEAIDVLNSKLRLSMVQSDGSYAVVSLVQYTVGSGASVKIPQQAREDTGYVPPEGGGIAGLVAGGSTVGSGFITFVNSNNITFGLSNNIMTASVIEGGGTGADIAISAGNYSTNDGTVVFRNSNGISFGMDTNAEITASYTVPEYFNDVFSNSNNVSFGLSGSTYTAIASFDQTVQTQGLVNIEGSTGSIHFSNANGVSFGGSLNTITASVVIPDQTVQTQGMVNIEGSTGSIHFGSANGLSFGFSNSTITASYTVPVVPPQTVQPVAASASNGSFAFSTLGFNNGGGVTFSSDVFGINAIVKTDYQTSGAYLTTAMASNAGSNFQSANPNYLTSQSNQAVSGSNGSFAFQTLSLGASNGATFYTTNSSVVVSYTVPSIPAQTYQPVAVSGSNGSMTASTLSFGASNNVTFYTTNGSLVASIPASPAVIGISAGTISTNDSHFTFVNSNNVSFGLETVNNNITASASFAQSNQPVAASASNGSFNFSTLKFVEGSGVTWATQAGGIQASVKTDYQSSNANYLTSQSNQAFSASGGSSAFQTLNFANSNSVTFSNSGGSVIASISFPAQTVQPVAASGSNGSFTFSTLTFGNSNGLTHYTTNGSIVASYTVPSIPGATVFSNSNNVSFTLNGSTVNASASFPAQTVQPVAASASNGSFNFSTLKFVEGSGVTWATQVNGIQASVKTDYQSSNANYLTSQSNQAFSASGGSSAFQTLNFANSNNVTFSNSNGSVVASASFAQSTQPVAASGSNGSFTFSTLTFGASNGATFYTTNNSVVVSYTVPSQTTQPVAVSAQGGSSAFSTLNFVNTQGVSFSNSNGSIYASVKTDYQSSNANYLTSQSTGPSAIAVPGTTVSSGTIVFSNSNGVSFGYGTGTATNIITVTVQPGAAAGIAALSAGTQQATSGTVQFINSNGVSFGMGSGASAGQITASISPAAATGIGAIAGGGNTATSGTVVFSNSNNVSFTFNGSTQMVASASFPAQSTQPVAVSGSNGSFTFSTLTMGASNGLTFYTTNGSVVGSYTVPAIPGATVFSNSNNVTFGLNVSTVTADAQMRVSASNGSYLNSHIKFAQGGGVTWSTDSNGVNATVKTDYQSSNANYLTSQSVQPVIASASNGSYNFSTLKFVEGSGVTWATQAGGIQASVKTDYQSSNANYLTSQSNQAFSASGGSSAFQTLNFANSNNVTFSNSNGSVVASASFAQSVQPVAASGSNGSFQFSTLTFGASNGATFYTTNNSVVVSYTVPTQSTQPVAFSASGGSSAFSTLVFGNGSGVTFSNSNGSIVATVNTDYQSSNANYLTSQTNQTLGLYAVGTTTGASSSNTVDARSFSIQGAGNISVGLTNGSFVISQTGGGVGGGAALQGSGTYTQNTGTIQFANSNQITFGLSANGVMTASYSNTDHYNNIAAGGATASTDATVVFSNSNGVSFGLGGVSNSQMTANFSGPRGVVVNASASTLTNGNLVFSNSNGVSFGINGSTITAAGDWPDIAVPGSTVSGNSVVFSNSNGVSFGLNGSTMTAALSQSIYASGNTTGQSSSSGYNASALTIVGDNGISIGWSNGSLRFSGNQGTINQTGPNFAAGGVTVTNGTVVFSNSNNVSFGLAGSTMTASAANRMLSIYEPYELAGASTATIAGNQTNTSNAVNFYPFNLPDDMTVGFLKMIFTVGTTSITSNTVASHTAGYRMGIYSRGTGAGTATLGLVTSNSFAYSGSANSNSFSQVYQGVSSYSGLGNVSTSFSGTNTWSLFSGYKAINIPLNTTLSAGKYWLGVMGTYSSVQTINGFTMNPIGVVVPITVALSLGALNLASSGQTAVSNDFANYYLGLGSWTSAGSVTGLPNSVSLASISRGLSIIPAFKFWST